jgi:hypothetical protein
MEIHDLVDVALADVDERRIELIALEPAELSPYSVGGLGQILTELVGQIGGPDECRMAGSWEGDTYLIAVSWSGREPAIMLLDRLVHDVEASLAMASVARMATSKGIGVRFVPGPDAITAQISLPASIVSKSEHPASAIEGMEDTPFLPHELDRRVPVAAGSWLDESEAFLERVFAPLRLSWVGPAETGEGVALQVRVPGERFIELEDDSPSTVAAEAAVEIRSALSTFDQGRRSAELAG